MDENRLRKLMRIRRTGPGRKSWRCPDPPIVAAYADGQLEGKSRQRLEAHFADCDYCLNELTVLVRAQESANEFEVSPEMLARVRSLGGTKTLFGLKPAWGWTAASAATVLAVLVISLAIREPRTILSPTVPVAVTSEKETLTRPSVPKLNTLAPPSVRNAQKMGSLPELISPLEGAVISRKGMEFRWREVRGSIDYDLVVVTAEGNVIWEKRTESTHVQLPEDILLTPGQKYFTWVRANLPEGKTVKSGVVSFQIENH